MLVLLGGGRRRGRSRGKTEGCEVSGDYGVEEV